MKNLNCLIRIDNGYIVLDKYDISLTRIQTPADLIHWICHLSDKSWVTIPILKRFICLVCEEQNLNIPGGFY